MFPSLSFIAKIPKVSLISGTITFAFIFHLSIPFFRGYLQPKIHSETTLFLRLAFSVLQHDFDDFCHWKDWKFLQNPPEFQWKSFLKRVTDEIESKGLDRLIVLLDQRNSSSANSVELTEFAKFDYQSTFAESDEHDDSGSDKMLPIDLSHLKFLISEHEYKIRLHRDAYKNILFYKIHQLKPLNEFQPEQLIEFKEILQNFARNVVNSKHLLEEKITFLNEMIKYKKTTENPDSQFIYKSVKDKMKETMGGFVADILDLFKSPTAEFNEEYYQKVEHLFMEDMVSSYILSKNELFLQTISKIEDFLKYIDSKQ